MKKTSGSKAIFAAVVMVFCLAMLAGCGAKDKTGTTGADSTQAEATAPDPAVAAEPTFVVDTPCGGLTYPETWKDQLQTEITETDSGCDVSFSTSIGEEKYRLFTVIIGGDDDSAGTLTAEDGIVRNVALDVPDLGDISSLSQNDQDQLYAMQEGLNVVVENLG